MKNNKKRYKIQYRKGADYMLKENDQLTPLMLKEPLPGRQLVLAQHDSLTVSQAAERFIEMFTSI